MSTPFVILSGSSHPAFAKKLAKGMGVELGRVEIAQFSDSETHVIVHEHVAGKEVFIVQSGFTPTNERVMELLLLVEATWRKKAKRITVVLPFMPYRRQEKQTLKGETLAFDVIARILRSVGVKRVLTMDLHKHRSKRFFVEQRIACTELRAFPIFIEHLRSMRSDNMVVVAPDKGSVPESEKYAKALRVPLVKFFKHRAKRDQVVVDRFEGAVAGKEVLIIDDEINTGGTLAGVIRILKQHGAISITFAATHGVLSGPAKERLSQASLKRMIITDTIPLPRSKKIPNIAVLSVVPLFVRQLQRWVK